MKSANRKVARALLPARKILVIRYRFIGDTILTVPFLRNLRAAYPHAAIDVLVGPQSGRVLEGCPYVDELICFDTTRFHKYDSGPGSSRSFTSYALQLRRRRYDLVFILKRSWSSGLLAWLSGARYRVGYDTEGRRLFLTHPVPWDAGKHEVESTLDVLEAAGVPVFDDHLEAWVSDGERQSLDSLVPELGGSSSARVLIHAAAAHPDKMYPLESWAAVLAGLGQRQPVSFYFTGAEPDRELYSNLERLSGIRGINLAGRLSLRQSLALYERMDLAVCVDSGPAHMAAAAGAPTVSIFGPTDAGRWRPWGDGHVAVFDRSLCACPCVINSTCPDRPCLTRLPPALVVEKCLPLLAGARKSTTGGALS